MSVIYKGNIIESNLSVRANGGTEQMRTKLIRDVGIDALSRVAIHLSRVRNKEGLNDVFTDVPNILWCHDLAEDTENRILENGGWNKFICLVFVSAWQRDTYIERYKIPYAKCFVIENYVDAAEDPLDKSGDEIRMVYHTTPHRGLALLYHVFDALCQHDLYKGKLHLDVFSSFEIYGWKERDKQFEPLYEKLRAHPNITYHGTRPNSEVRKHLARAHFFPYPCIWKETSCLALMEAIEHKVLAVHPNYGALTETAGSNTFIYNYIDDLETHMNHFYTTILFAMNHRLDKSFSINTNYRNQQLSFSRRWLQLLKAIP